MPRSGPARSCKLFTRRCARSRRASRVTVTGPTNWPRFKRPCWRASSGATRSCLADAPPALFLAKHSEHRAALHDHHVRSDLTNRRRAADIALRLERAAFVEAVAGRAEVAQDARPDQLPTVLRNLVPGRFGRPADRAAISAAAARDIDDDAALRIGPLALEGLSGR